MILLILVFLCMQSNQSSNIPSNMRNICKSPTLHKLYPSRLILPYRIHALLYAACLSALFYRHLLHLLRSPSLPSFFLSFSLFAADLVLAFMWALNQSFRWRPVRRRTFPESLPAAVDDGGLPGLDVFICTADPFKEPPMSVVNTALSVMAFDYPPEKVAVYVSDDGGSALTLFAFMEAARFAQHWLPFCRENCVDVRCPEVVFCSGAGDRPSPIKVRSCLVGPTGNLFCPCRT